MKYLMLALSYLPSVLQGVTAVEATLQGASGATKKEAVLAAVQTASKVGENVDENHVKVISQLIDDVVGALNKTGFFAKKS